MNIESMEVSDDKQNSTVKSRHSKRGKNKIQTKEKGNANRKQTQSNAGKSSGRGKGKTNNRVGQKDNDADKKIDGKKPSTPAVALSNQKSKKNGQARNQRSNRNKQNENIVYPAYLELKECLTRYNAKDPNIIRGILRVLPARDAMSFCTCDRGSQKRDVVIEGPLERNRALDGDVVFVELLPREDCNTPEQETEEESNDSEVEPMVIGKADDRSSDGVKETWWQDDRIQMDLWAPVVPIQRKSGIPKLNASGDDEEMLQQRGRVVHVVPPKAISSEINPTKKTAATCRRLVGYLKRLQSGTTLLTCANKSLPQFKLSNTDSEKFRNSPEEAIFQAKYVYGSWKESMKWPPCKDIDQFGLSCNVEDETTALLIDNQVDHGEFPQTVLQECNQVVADGEYSTGTHSGWKPTQEMYKGRRDYRKRRIFTIDPTTAKDLDDALHIEELDNGQIEIGVHIADVSFFVQNDSQIDQEASRRCTTVYLVDRTIPMLPRPLCEIACSLNENVERLAFSCVWRMNRDGSVVHGQKVWYGRTVIKSCARLDYTTAQNIIENKVAYGENVPDEELWPLSRRPTGGHTMNEVAADVRLMNQVAQARRSLRFRNGAVALNAVKLTFQLGEDRETPLLCQPYAIRDSNRLVEEYMLLANYLVAQRLITHAGGRALLRNHEPPLYDGLEKVSEMAMATIGFRIDISSSEALQRSLNRLGRECNDELVLKCITEMLKMPMRPANYIAAGEIPNEAWAHFALNIPYYTHFTSPIRRYADVIVHRLLQATLDGEETVENFPLSEKEIGNICKNCNEKKEGSRKAQERSDVVFLALYLKHHPMTSQHGVVLSVGQKTFTVFIPALGISSLVYLDEHKHWISFEAYDHLGSERRIKLERTTRHKDEHWTHLVIKNFARLRVTCKCQDRPPISVKLELEGPWSDD